MRFSSELGTKRARAGISPDALISAVRLDFSILWDELSADTISQATAALITDPDARFSIVAASGEAASQLRAIASAARTADRLPCSSTLRTWAHWRQKLSWSRVWPPMRPSRSYWQGSPQEYRSRRSWCTDQRVD